MFLLFLSLQALVKSVSHPPVHPLSCLMACSPCHSIWYQWKVSNQKTYLTILLLVKFIYLWNTVQLLWCNLDLIFTLLVVNKNLCNCLEFSLHVKPHFFFFLIPKAYVVILNWSTISKHLPWVNTGSLLWVLYLVSGKHWTSEFPVIFLVK